MKLLEEFIAFYTNNRLKIDLLKDCIYFIGILALIKPIFNFFKYLKNKNLNESSKKISLNLNFREKIDPKLSEYISKSQIKDICIRLYFWKNYPDHHFENDGYKFHLNIVYYNDRPSHGWIDNNCIFLCDWIGWSGNKLYKDDLGFFIIDKPCKEYPFFKEYTDCYYVYALPFNHIVNYDFNNLKDYEPAFYTKYPHNSKNLFLNIITIRAKNNDFSSFKLNKKQRIYYYNKYIYLIRRYFYLFKKKLAYYLLA